MARILVYLVPLLVLYLRDPAFSPFPADLAREVIFATLASNALLLLLHGIMSLLLQKLRPRVNQDRLHSLFLFLLLGLFYIQVQLWYLPDAVAHWFNPGFPIIGDLVLTLPVFSGLIWVRVFHQRQVLRRLGRYRKLSADLMFNLRSAGVMMGPQLLYLNGYRSLFMSEGVLSRWADTYPAFAMAAGALLFFMILLISPALVRFLYPTASLGELGGMEGVEQELRALASRAGMKVTRIMVWKTGSHRIANAAVTGLIKGYQIFFITDYLLKNLEKDQLLAVMAHEIGHSKLKHMFFNFLLAISAGIFLIWSLVVFGPLLDDWGIMGRETSPLVILGLDAVYIFFVFSFFLRMFEHQADMVAASLTGGITDFSAALETLGRLNMVSSSRRSLTHPSIDARLKWLRERTEKASPEHWLKVFRRRNLLLTGVVTGLYAITLVMVNITV